MISNTTAPYPTVLAALQAAGATTTVVTVGTPSPNPPSIVSTEFKRDLNAYLSGIPGAGAKSLQGIIDYDNANPIEGLKYQQGELIAAQAIDLSDPTTATTYSTNLTTGKAANAAVIDAILTNGTPDTADDYDAIVVPSGNGLVGVADRAGYPVLTVPAGFGTGSAGRNPIGVTFVGTAFSEPKLLADGYAFEQATNVRLAPSFTNPSMWRCVPGSTFFSGELCNPGDRLVTPTCTHDGMTGPQTIASGETICLRNGAQIAGAVTVKAGGTLEVDGGKITGPVTVTAGALVELCDTTITGPLTITGGTGLVTVGGDEATGPCDGNTITGGVTITGNKAGVEFNGNKVTGPVTITGNTGSLPPPDLGSVHATSNTVTGPAKIQS